MDGVDAMRRQEVVSFGSQSLAAQIEVTGFNGREIRIRAADILAVHNLGEDVAPLGTAPICEIFFGTHSAILRETVTDVLALIDASLSTGFGSLLGVSEHFRVQHFRTAAATTWTTLDFTILTEGLLFLDIATQKTVVISGSFIVDIQPD